MHFTAEEYQARLRDPIHDLVRASAEGISFIDLDDDVAERLRLEAEDAFTRVENSGGEIGRSHWDSRYQVVTVEATGHAVCATLLDEAWAKYVERPRLVAEIAARRSVTPAGYAGHKNVDDTTVVLTHDISEQVPSERFVFGIEGGREIPLQAGRMIIVPDNTETDKGTESQWHVVRGRAKRLLSAWTMIAPGKALF